MPNAAHLHLVIVHAAPAFLWAGVLVLVFTRWFPKEAGMRLLAVLFLIIAALGLVLAANTGEGAVDVLRSDPTVNSKLVHDHEEVGELVFPLALMAAFMAVIWFILARKDDRHATGWVWWIVVAVALGTAGMATYTGHIGGRIRHPEVIPGYEMGMSSERDTKEVSLSIISANTDTPFRLDRKLES